MKEIERLEKEHLRMDLPAFGPGDTVKVHVKIKEGEKRTYSGLPGRCHLQTQRLHQCNIYRAQGFLRHWCGTYLPDAFTHY